MGAFDDLLSDVFSDPDFSIAASYVPRDGSPGYDLMLGLVDPDESLALLSGSTTLETVTAEARVIDLPVCRSGDTLIIHYATGDEPFQVGTMRRKPDRTLWSLDLRKQPT